MFIGLCGSEGDIISDKLTPRDEHMVVHVEVSHRTFQDSNDVADLSRRGNLLKGFRTAILVVWIGESEQWVSSSSVLRVPGVVLRAIKVSVDESQ